MDSNCKTQVPTKVTVMNGTKCAAPSKVNGEKLGITSFYEKIHLV